MSTDSLWLCLSKAVTTSVVNLFEVFFMKVVSSLAVKGVIFQTIGPWRGQSSPEGSLHSKTTGSAE